MSDSGGDEPTVLIVEDEAKIRETYQLWLADDYEVHTAEDGAEALTVVDEMAGEPDFALLDRLMPGMSGKETLAELCDRDLDCRYAMVTAVEPDFDVVEMGFDAYLTKPVREAELRATLSELADQADYDDALDEYTSLLAKREALEARKSADELEESAEFARLERRLAELDDRLSEVAEPSDDAGFVASLRDVGGDAE